MDSRCGVITAVVTTPGDVPEPTQTVTLLDQHEQTTGGVVTTVVGDQQYGTTDNHRQMQERGVRTHLKTVPGRPADAERFAPERSTYDEVTDRYQCPAGQTLFPRGYNPRRQSTEYLPRKGVCAACPLRPQCTDSPSGRHITRQRLHDLVLRARAQAHNPAARRDYRRHRHLMEGSFAQSANCHGGKRSRWRRLARQQIQDWLIAACQNVKRLVKALRPGPLAVENRGQPAPTRPQASVGRTLRSFGVEIFQLIAPTSLLSPQPC